MSAGKRIWVHTSLSPGCCKYCKALIYAIVILLSIKFHIDLEGGSFTTIRNFISFSHQTDRIRHLSAIYKLITYIVIGHEQVTKLLSEPDRVKEEEMAMGEIRKQMESLKQDASSHTNTLSRLMHEDFAIDVAAAWQR